MAVSSASPYAQRAAAISTGNNNPHSEKMNRKAETEPVMNEKSHAYTDSEAHVHAHHLQAATMELPKTSIDTSSSSANASSVDTAVDFNGDVNTNNEIPSQKVLRSVEDMTVLDKDGKIIPFKHLYSGPNVTRRVLVIFIRHFFCGVRSHPTFDSFLPPSAPRLCSLNQTSTDLKSRTAKNTSEPSPTP